MGDQAGRFQIPVSDKLVESVGYLMDRTMIKQPV